MENTSEELGGFPIEPQMTYIPNVEDDMKPKVGQIFESLDATYKFYNAYARKAGFSVRKSKETKKNGMVYWKKYVCYKEGETEETWRNNNKVEERDRKNTRTGCDAKLTVYSDGSNYVVKSFKEEHNHSPTTPSRVHLLTSHRTVSIAKKNLVQDLKKVDIPVYQQFELFETQAGGHENVGCTERDLRNAVRDHREEVKGHDVDILYEHFKAEQEKDPDFFFEFDTDAENRQVRCFWVDSSGKKIKKLNLSVGQEAVNNSINGIYEKNRFLDPSQAKTKGSGKRILSWRDRKGKVRHCSVCRSTKHTKQTCTFQRSNVGENDADVAADEEDYVVDEL